VSRSGTPGGLQADGVGELGGGEEVPPAGDHVHRRHPGEVGAVVVGDVPERIAGVGVRGEIAPERHRRPDDGGVGRLQRQHPQRPLRRAGAAGAAAAARDAAGLLAADGHRPPQRVLQSRAPWT
jgi:hypothetical protein